MVVAARSRSPVFSSLVLALVCSREVVASWPGCAMPSSGASQSARSSIFGDAAGAAGENADVIYSYVAYYNTAWNPPQFTSGSISEFAIWQGNQKALWPLLYNAGTFVSVKQLLGIQRNYVDKSDKWPTFVQKNITLNPSTNSTTFVLEPEMEAFVVADLIAFANDWAGYNDTVAQEVNITVAVDGVAPPSGNSSPGIAYYNAPTGTSAAALSVRGIAKTNLGLHKIEGRIRVSANNAFTHSRNLTMEPHL